MSTVNKMSPIELWLLIYRSINENNFLSFNTCLNEKHFDDYALSRPRFINDAINECLKNEKNGCEFLELLLAKLYLENCYFECWQETCKSVVKLFIQKSKQFTAYSIYFLLRCYDICLIGLAFQHDLLAEFCQGYCEDWHLMFVASYQERFFAHCFDNLVEGFLSRYLLINRLRCSLNQKRTFLTWFAGSLHLYYDDQNFTDKDEAEFYIVLNKVFEALILNGLLNNDEYKNLYDMCIKRNRDLANQSYTIHMHDLYPLSLKNICRINIKRHLKKYTHTYVQENLPIPKNLQRFLLFENECDSVMKLYKTLSDNLNVKSSQTQTDI